MEEQKNNVEDIVRKRREQREADEQAAIRQQLEREKHVPKLQQSAEPVEHIMQFFRYDHLPPVLAAISKPFCDIANAVVNDLPRNPERTVALRKLLEAKDAAVRAFAAGR